MTRRDFLILPLPALLALLACFGSRPLRTALAGFFEDRKSAASVGEEYLRLHPTEDDDDQLVRRLAGERSREVEWERLAASDPAAFRESVRARHREDFAAGRTVTLRGWVLSETEARLCALAARTA